MQSPDFADHKVAIATPATFDIINMVPFLGAGAPLKVGRNALMGLRFPGPLHPSCTSVMSFKLIVIYYHFVTVYIFEC